MINPKLAKYKLPINQRGEGGIVGIVSIIILIVLCVKIGLAIVPAQINDRQLDEAIAKELKQTNDLKESKAKLIKSIKAQLKINGYYNMPLEEMYTFEGSLGKFSVKKEYEVESNFIPTVFITNKFEGKIEAAGTE